MFAKIDEKIQARGKCKAKNKKQNNKTLVFVVSVICYKLLKSSN